MPPIEMDIQRQFAVDVVCRLHEAGHEAYWAGGCVRDQLLGKTPHDYDVATDATPDEVRRLFGHRKTLAIGAAFGVVTVRGPRRAGQIEVATFRRDAAYRDGRRPERVIYSDAQDDALRRDFTINGMFYDPLEDRVIDYVGGQADLAAGVVRAIGEPRERFGEDKLRLLRAVRFAAALGFALETQTGRTIAEMAAEIRVVSAERIAAEMERMLVCRGRATAIRLLVETGLAEVVLPEIVPRGELKRDRLRQTLDVLDRLASPSFALALAAILCFWVDGQAAQAVCRRWKLSHRLSEETVWLVAHRDALRNAAIARWSAIQPVVASPYIEPLLALIEATAAVEGRAADEVAFCRRRLSQGPSVVNPAPLVGGDDLRQCSIAPGPAYRVVLARLRDAQLDGEIRTRAEALALAGRLVSELPPEKR